MQGTPATPGVFWRGLRLVSLDGTLFDVPASDANTAYFKSSSNGEQKAGYPQARMVALGECGTHAVVGAAFGPFATGERTLAHRLRHHLKADMLLLADRGFPSFGLWEKAAATGAGLLCRVSDSFRLPLVEVLPDGTYLSRRPRDEPHPGDYRHATAVASAPRTADCRQAGSGSGEARP